jgi:glycosyltransferase involved in cell wall biosynthesis
MAIDAARRVGMPLRIAGPICDPDFFRTEIEPRLGSGVVHLGHLQHQTLASIVGGASAALCTPRWEEPYGLVVAEALACGTPVAAFRRGGVPAILSPECGRLAEPDDVASLARAIREASMLDRRACRRRAEAICDAKRMVDAYERIYEAMLSPGKAPANTASPTGDVPLLSVA